MEREKLDADTLKAELVRLSELPAVLADLSSSEDRIRVDMITRKVTVSTSFGVEYDHLAVKKVLEVDRYVDGVDLSKKACAIHWMNGQNAGVFLATEKDLSKKDRLLVAWDITNEYTQYGGTIQFAVHFYSVVDGAFTYHIASEIGTGKLGRTLICEGHRTELNGEESAATQSVMLHYGELPDTEALQGTSVLTQSGNTQDPEALRATTLFAQLKAAEASPVLFTDLSGISDTDDKILIDMASRKVTVRQGFGVEYDHLARKKVFELDRYVNGVDLSEKACAIHWMNGTEGGICPVTEKDVSKEGKLLIAWNITNEYTRHSGSIRFALHFYSIVDNSYTYHISSEIGSGSLGKTLNATEHAVENITPSEMDAFIQHMARLESSLNSTIQENIQKAEEATAQASQAGKTCEELTLQAKEALQNQQQLTETLKQSTAIKDKVEEVHAGIKADKEQVAADRKAIEDLIANTDFASDLIYDAAQRTVSIKKGGAN